MSEHETIEKVKRKQGIVSKIQDFFLLGYSTKEDLRELDKQLRDTYYQDLRDLRHQWEVLYLAILDAGVSVSNRELKRVIQVLDRVMAKIHRADYGYAGLWDRKGHIREHELARVVNYDKSLSADIDSMDHAIQQMARDVDAANWTQVRADVKTVKQLLYALEDKWQDRETLFRPVEV